MPDDKKPTKKLMWEGASRLDKLLDARGISNTDFGKAIGVSHAAVSRYRSGERAPRADKLARICRELHVSADELLGLSSSELLQAEREAARVDREEATRLRERMAALEALLRDGRTSS